MNIIKKIKNLFKRRTLPDIPAGWRENRGRYVQVLVIDTGEPDDSHDMAYEINTAYGRSFVWGEPDVRDENGHATAVCGVIHGIAPDARMTCFKAAGKDGHGTTTDLRLALEAAVELEPDVVNISLAVRNGASKMKAALDELRRMNIPVICGAGNDGGEGVMYPAKFGNTIAVGACDERGRQPSWSARGPEVDVLMPGLRIRTAGPHGGTAVVSGTSFAAPHATGVAALYIAWWRSFLDAGVEDRSRPNINSVAQAVRQCGVEARA